MKDARMLKLAKSLIAYSTNVQKGERVLIENTGILPDFVCALVDETYKAGGHPVVWLKDPKINRALLMHQSEEECMRTAEHDAKLLQSCQAYIGIRAGDNAFEMSDVPAAQLSMQSKLYWSKVHGNIRVPYTKWAVLRYPVPSMAQQANMSTDAFEDFYFDVCTMDYQKMSKAMDPLVERMNKADKVHIIGKGTDLTFSIKGLPAVKCDGKLNIPDGEIFTAPVRDSVNGQITYTAKSLHDGITHQNICLTFENGKIIKETGNHPDVLTDIFNTDEGARYVGEFAIGVNPYITNEMLDTLFDEKIAGSFHFTPGNAYDECDNGNKSALHWDLVCIQTKEYGGGEIWFDDELIRKDGLFVPEYLKLLNPDQLK